ncbi:eukaryotic-type carbonic anhydrase domain-containing protein [Ditylenchus destructor]|uniref:Carbonic anhydrase n=1 Tax=Ditylenchus destructor TaxID=166010 RepID=A0AAD4NCR0_9BILA|nr:eukaryotic-type carbonic anhydrase domain-containing protein [Ditylenchus destructor]
MTLCLILFAIDRIFAQGVGSNSIQSLHSISPIVGPDDQLWTGAGPATQQLHSGNAPMSSVFSADPKTQNYQSKPQEQIYPPPAPTQSMDVLQNHPRSANPNMAHLEGEDTWRRLEVEGRHVKSGNHQGGSALKPPYVTASKYELPPRRQDNFRGGGDDGSWGYEPHNGPEHWRGKCREGLRQSPVDIRSVDVDFAFINALEFVNYEKAGRIQVKNTGHGVKVDGFERWNASDRPFIYSGGLNGRYLLSQFHFHWSAIHDDGSEHAVGALHYPVEAHFVHMKEGYSPQEALIQPDGLAVVAVFFFVSNDGTAWMTLDSGLRKLIKGDQSTIVFNYAPWVTLPTNVENFYRYNGSLTTPPCSEVVTWTILAEPVSITQAQLDMLRQIRVNDTIKLEYNNRPTYPLNGRRIQYRSATLNRGSICNVVSGQSSGSKPDSSERGAASHEKIQISLFILSILTCMLFFAF